MSPAAATTLSKSFTTDVKKILLRIRASIAMIHCLNSRATPDINTRLTNVINNIGAQWDHRQAMWNRDPAMVNRQTTIGDFWSEWVQDYYPWLIRHTTTWAQNTINILRGFAAPRTGNDARIVLEVLANLEGQLVGLTIDTSRMN
jgi:chitinase